MGATKRSLAAALVLVVAVACSGSEGVAPPEGRGIRSSPAPPGKTARSPGGGKLRLKRLNIALRPVASGFEAPLYATHAGDGTSYLFVVEQVGRIKIVQRGTVRPEPFLDIAGRLTSGGEQGLLGLAFHPDYESNGRFFVNYTDTSGDTVVAEYRSATATTADPDSERVLMRIEQPYANHNGGDLEFGPDGYLYIATGDGGSGGDPHGNGQSTATLLGKILRVDVDAQSGDLPYGIPPDNPFRDDPDARAEIWALGLRNPWRFSFDRTGIWIADVGQSSWEEVNRMPVDQAGLNYGWNRMEGESCYEPASGCSAEGLVLPLATYSHDFGCSITGGYVYRGRRFPKMQGAYVFGDYCSGLIWGLRAGGKSTQRPVRLLESGHSISSFGVSRSGEVFVTDISSGELLRIVAR